MTRSAPLSRQRQRDALAVFEHFGFAEGRTAPGGATSCARFARSINSLGPLLQSFCSYLGTRPDLLAATDREQFATAPRVERAINPETVSRIVRRELGALADQLELSATAGEPATLRASWPLWVVIPARLEGSPVLVKLLRPEAEQAIVDDLDLLGWVAGRRLLGCDHHPVDLRCAADGFLEHLRLRVDLREERRSLMLLPSERARVPSYQEVFSSRRLIVYEDVGASPLNRARHTAGGADAGGTTPGGAESDDDSGAAEAVKSSLASRDISRSRAVMTTWLELLFCDRILLEEPEAGLVDLLEDELIVSGGSCYSLDDRTVRLLERYLLAAADGRADRAHRALLKLSDGDPQPSPKLSVDDRGLRTALRQAVPYRDHGLPESRLLPVLLDSVLPHARLLRKTGHAPSRSLLAFYRALSFLERLQTGLSPGDDAFLAAMRRYRVLRAARSVRSAAAPRGWTSAVSETVPAVIDLVERLEEDDGSGASDGEPRPDVKDRGSGPQIATALAAIALLLVAVRWLELAADAGVERVVALVLLGIGLLLLLPWRKRGARR